MQAKEQWVNGWLACLPRSPPGARAPSRGPGVATWPAAGSAAASAAAAAAATTGGPAAMSGDSSPRARFLRMLSSISRKNSFFLASASSLACRSSGDVSSSGLFQVVSLVTCKRHRGAPEVSGARARKSPTKSGRGKGCLVVVVGAARAGVCGAPPERLGLQEANGAERGGKAEEGARWCQQSGGRGPAGRREGREQ